VVDERPGSWVDPSARDKCRTPTTLSLSETPGNESELAATSADENSMSIFDGAAVSWPTTLGQKRFLAGIKRGLFTFDISCKGEIAAKGSSTRGFTEISIVCWHVNSDIVAGHSSP